MRGLDAPRARVDRSGGSTWQRMIAVLGVHGDGLRKIRRDPNVRTFSRDALCEKGRCSGIFVDATETAIHPRLRAAQGADEVIEILADEPDVPHALFTADALLQERIVILDRHRG